MVSTAYAAAFDFARVTSALKKHAEKVDVPVVTLMAMQGKSPYKVLFTTILSARTKDQTTLAAATRLFAKAPTLDTLCQLSEEQISELIYPVGFYKTKAKNIVKTAEVLQQEFSGQVPKTVEALVQLPGVGRKTATLVVAECFATSAICVDTHVHRISNRLGIVKSKSPADTEQDLMRVLPKKYWRVWNPLLVAYGQSLCTPISPKCSQCPIRAHCKRVGVTSSR